MKKKYDLKEMAQSGYIMGLGTIGEVANHMDLHYDLYFSIEDLTAETNALNALIAGHEDDSIELYLTAEDKRQMDDEMEKAFAESPDAPPEDFDMT